LVKKINENNREVYKTIDLFCGIGGIRKGFEKTGYFKNVLSAEIDKYACITYSHLFNENPYNDVTSEIFKVKVENTKYDILLAGFPCQSFSIAGEKKGFKDKTRGTLFFDVADIINRSKPKAFLLENVEGLITHDKGQTFKIILNVLIKDLNYTIVGVTKNEDELIYEKDSFIRKTKDFGLPQKRSRTYIVGFRTDLLPDNFELQELPRTNEKFIFNNVYEILEDNVSPKYYLSEQYIETLERHKKRHKSNGNGFGFQIVNSGENPIANTILATGGSGKERNLICQEKEEYYGKIFGTKKSPINSKGIRVMTPNEWARLQGFKDYAFIENKFDQFSFPDCISDAQKYKQLGNTVSIPVIEELSKYIYHTLEKLKKKEEYGF
jgi:DNA (cytosine-5)-methyltransferase 1